MHNNKLKVETEKITYRKSFELCPSFRNEKSTQSMKA